MVTTTTKTLAERVDQIRLAAGVNLLPLSEATGIPRTTLRRILNGHSDPTVGQFMAICHELGASPSELLAEFEKVAA